MMPDADLAWLILARGGGVNQRDLVRLVTILDADNDRTFDMLMGNEIAPCKCFIQSHAKKVRNLDVWSLQ